MRILHINPFYFPYDGGIERRIRGLARDFKARGHEVHVLTGQLPGTARSEVLDGVPVTRLPSKVYNVYNPPYITSKGAESAIRKVAPDVIDFHYRWAPSFTRAVRSVAGTVPVVFNFHNTFAEGSGFWGAVSWLNDTRFKKFLARCRQVVCVSDYVRRQLVAAGVGADGLEVVYNGIDPTPEAEVERLARCVPSSEPPYCVFVGRLVRIKGIDVLIDAAARTESQVRFKVIGQGPARADLEARAARRGVAARFDFMGYVEEARKREWIAGARALTHASRFEAFGLAPLEALDLACPVICTQSGGTPEVVGGGGVSVPLDDPRAFAGAVDRLMGDEEERLRLARAARARSARFAWPEIAREMERVYERATAAR